MEDCKTPEEWMYAATAFELLSLAFLLPTKDTAGALVAGEFTDACKEVIDALECDSSGINEIVPRLSGYREKEVDEVFHALRKEYTYLFVGEKEPQITPFVGVFAAQERGQKGLLFVSKESVEIEYFMRDRGVAKNLALGQVNDPVDHIGTVCEFLKYLCLVNAKAVQPPGNVVIADVDCEVFVEDIFAPYAQWFSGQVFDQARCPFYEAMALFLIQACGSIVPKLLSVNRLSYS